MTLRLSNSEMKDFRRCRRKWYLAAYRGLHSREALPPGSPLSLGTLVHDALAAYYDPERREDPLAYIQTTLNAALAADADGNRGPALLDEANFAKIMVEGYLEWLAEEGCDADLEILGVERMGEAQLAEGVTVISKLDAPVKRLSDGALLALEHKTTASLSRPNALLKLDTQLLTEHLVRFMDAIEKGATKEEAYDQCHGILYNQLRKVKRTATAKPPFYLRTDVLHNIHELRNHWRHVAEIAREILAVKVRLDAGEDHHAVCPPNPTNDCTWDCAFFKVCVMADDGSDFEGALDALYEEGDPLERYLGAEPL